MQSMCALADELKAACEAQQQTRLLLDCAGMTGAVPLADLFLVGQYYAELFHDEYKIAAINTPTHWHDNDFSETVMRQHGGHLNHFANAQQAIKWLTERTSPQHRTES